MRAQLGPKVVPRMREHPPNPSKQTHKEYKRHWIFGKTKTQNPGRWNQKNILRQAATSRVIGAIFGSTTRAQGVSKNVGASDPPRKLTARNIQETREFEKGE